MQLTNEWIEQGLEQGRQQGSRAVILRQLRRRFGVLPTKFTRQIERLDDRTTLALADALLDFTSLADAQHWLAGRK